MNLDNIFTELAKYDTPTMCNAVEAVMGTRSAVGFTKKPVVSADPSLPCIVGFAATAKIRAASPPVITPEKVQENRLSYYEYVASAKDPTIIVIEDTDYPNCTGAFWGELNVAIHKGLKLKGTLTNGLLRDIGMLDKGYQVLAGGIGPSHAFVHVTQLNTAVNILGLEVKPGDLIHADLHGAMVVEKKHIEAMPEALKLVVAKEEPILKAARKKDFNIKKLINLGKLKLLNLDRLNQQMDIQSDGVFDYVEDITVKSSNGRVIFPVREPFGNYLSKQFDNPSLADKYSYQVLYDSTPD